MIFSKNLVESIEASRSRRSHVRIIRIHTDIGSKKLVPQHIQHVSFALSSACVALILKVGSKRKNGRHAKIWRPGGGGSAVERRSVGG